MNWWIVKLTHCQLKK